jgi:hypothetical protein
MATIVSRLTGNGTLLLNGNFDEFTGSPVVDSSVVLWFDPAQTTSYPGTGSTIQDLSATNNTGTFINSPTFTNALGGGSISFEGSSYINMLYEMPNTGSRTVLVAFRSTNTGIRQGIITTRDGTGGWFIATNRSGAGSFDYCHNNVANGQVIAFGLLANTWYIATAVYDAVTGYASVYINGVLAAGPTFMDPVLPNSALSSGIAREANSNGFQGSIGDVIVYNRALTANEVKMNYNTLAGRYGLPLITTAIPAIQRTTSNAIFAEEFDEVTYNTLTPVIKNLLTSSEEFVNWGTYLNTITSNQTTAPDGTLTADRVQVDPSGYTALVNLPTVVGVTYTFSLWIRSFTGSSGTWGINWYSNSSGHHRVAVPITRDWGRQLLTFTADNFQTNVYVGDNRSALATISDGYVWGAQLEVGSTATIYQGVASTGTLIPTGLDQRVDSMGNMFVSDKFDEFTGAPVVDSSLKVWLDAGQGTSYPETGTAWNDLSGNNNNFTLTSPSYNNEGSFNFTNIATQGASIAPSSNVEPSSLTVSAWVKMSVFNPLNDFEGQFATMVWKCNTDNSGGGSSYGLSLTGGAVPRFTVSTTALFSSTTLPSGTWVNIVGTYTAGGAMVLYRNGTIDVSTAGPAAIPYTAQALTVGTRLLSGFYQYPFNGAISVVKLYNRALSADEVAQNFNALRRRYGI